MTSVDQPLFVTSNSSCSLCFEDETFQWYKYDVFEENKGVNKTPFGKTEDGKVSQHAVENKAAMPTKACFSANDKYGCCTSNNVWQDQKIAKWNDKWCSQSVKKYSELEQHNEQKGKTFESFTDLQKHFSTVFEQKKKEVTVCDNSTSMDDDDKPPDYQQCVKEIMELQCQDPIKVVPTTTTATTSTATSATLTTAITLEPTTAWRDSVQTRSRTTSVSTRTEKPSNESSVVPATVSSWAELKEALNQSANEFAGETTAHGYKRTCSPNRNKRLRCFWILAVLGTATLVIANLSSVIQQQQSYSFSTSIRSEPSEKLLFPAVTVCNLSPINMKTVQKTLAEDDSDVVKTFVQEVIADGGENRMACTNASLATMSKFTTRDLENMTGWTIDDFFGACMWNSEPVPCFDLFVRAQSGTRGCFTFNGDPSNPYMTNRVGSFSGLALVLNVGRKSLPRGAKILLHNPGEFPNVKEMGLLIAPDTSTYLSIQKQQYKFLPYPYKAYGTDYCFDASSSPTNGIQNYYQNYTGHSACVANCFLHQLVQKCGCLAYGADPDVPGVPYCKMDVYHQCYQPTLQKLLTEYNLKKLQCFCPLPCSKTEYTCESSTTRYPHGMAGGFLNLPIVGNSDDEKNNWLELKIFCDELFTRVEEHVPMYTWTTTLSNIGGQMGLLTGASVLTVLEFMELLGIMGWTTAKMAAVYFTSAKSKGTVLRTANDRRLYHQNDDVEANRHYSRQE